MTQDTYPASFCPQFLLRNRLPRFERKPITIHHSNEREAARLSYSSWRNRCVTVTHSHRGNMQGEGNERLRSCSGRDGSNEMRRRLSRREGRLLNSSSRGTVGSTRRN